MKSKKIILILIILINMILTNYSQAVEFSASSPAVILFNTNTGKIVYEKNAYEKMYPASTTKIMTAILVLENGNLEDTTTVSFNSTILPAGYVGASLQVGEVFTINDLLHLLLIQSANDVANVLAEYVGGSVSNFANMMNAKAIEIGCQNTHFVNPNGVHDDNHYSTAYDLCLIANYAMKNDIFRQIVSTTSYTVPATNKYEERTIYNTNKLIHPFNQHTNTENIYYCEFATGIKTGYTTVAKNCLVASAKKDNTEFIVVILGAAEYETDYNSERYEDANQLLSKALNNYSFTTVKKSNDIVDTVEIPNGDFIRKKLNLVLEKDLNILMKTEDETTELIPEITLYNDKIQAPISKGDILGTITYTYDGVNYTQNLLAANNVATIEQINLYFNIALGLLLILITFVIVKHIRKK